MHISRTEWYGVCAMSSLLYTRAIPLKQIGEQGISKSFLFFLGGGWVGDNFKALGMRCEQILIKEFCFVFGAWEAKWNSPGKCIKHIHCRHWPDL